MLNELEHLCFPKAKVGKLLTGKVRSPQDLDLSPNDIVYMKQVLTLLSPYAFRPLLAAQVWGVPLGQLTAVVKSRSLTPKLDILMKVKSEYLEESPGNRLYIRDDSMQPWVDWGFRIFSGGGRRFIQTVDWERFMATTIIPDGAQFLKKGEEERVVEETPTPDFSALFASLSHGGSSKKKLRSRLMEDPDLLIDCVNNIQGGTWNQKEPLTEALVRRIHFLNEAYGDYVSWTEGEFLDPDGLRRLAAVTNQRFLWGSPTSLLEDHPQFTELKAYRTALDKPSREERRTAARVRKRGGPPPLPDPPPGEDDSGEGAVGVLSALAEVRQRRNQRPPVRTEPTPNRDLPANREELKEERPKANERIPPPPNNPAREVGASLIENNPLAVREDALSLIRNFGPAIPPSEYEKLAATLVVMKPDDWQSAIEEYIEATMLDGPLPKKG